MKQSTTIRSPFVCDLTAIAPEQRPAHQALAARLFGELALETRELSKGYTFHFGAEHLVEIASFVANERRCCPFFGFEIAVAPEGGPVTLSITGPAEVKAFIQKELLS
jgi:hypothetical protein